MNFLAHLFLADDSPDSLIGNILADFVDNDFQSKYDKEICKGILLHRKIDKFTDSHEVFLRSQHRLNGDFHLLKGIIIDIFYDHFLAKNWKHYSDLPLEAFCQKVYGILRKYVSIIPLRMQLMLPKMIEDNWLLSYREIEGIDKALKGLSQRLSRKNNLGKSVSELIKQYEAFNKDFQEFFPQLIQFAEETKARLV